MSTVRSCNGRGPSNRPRSTSQKPNDDRTHRSQAWVSAGRSLIGPAQCDGTPSDRICRFLDGAVYLVQPTKERRLFVVERFKLIIFDAVDVVRAAPHPDPAPHRTSVRHEGAGGSRRALPLARYDTLMLPPLSVWGVEFGRLVGCGATGV